MEKSHDSYRNIALALKRFDLALAYSTVTDIYSVPSLWGVLRTPRVTTPGFRFAGPLSPVGQTKR